MPPVDNNTSRPRSGAVEVPKSVVVKAPAGMTPLTAATAATAASPKPIVGVSRAFVRDEGDYNVQSVRRFFTKLMISGGQGQRLRSERWESMPVEHFFLSLNTQMPLFNPERQPCSAGVATVTAVFAGFIWD